MAIVSTAATWIAMAILLAWIAVVLADEFRRDRADASMKLLSYRLQALTFGALIIASLLLCGLGMQQDPPEKWSVFVLLNVPLQAVNLWVCLKLIRREQSPA